ncbi:molecular chaperone [Stutzerimonas stutzeri]|uniref:molecular chaperone n=1 Tax=Stutzerimonas sp. S1 TaxID=3030652 RepID=UPI0022249938|nr:molecular chaperone [Stutzerimonas sp. S1]MCW3147328.1 molecular chaperone [Stutzerimonas sp. S1]
MQQWLSGLPKANLGEMARQLYQALVELNQLRVPSQTRLQLLELLRPEVHYVCTHLERHYLNQPIVLGERPRKVAGLCQALQNHLATGYKLIVVRVIARPERDRQQLLTVALQRAVHSLVALLVRSTQLYSPAAESLWLELHRLYQLATQNALQGVPVRDELAHDGHALSTEQCYIAALLLGCARCNQMRQQAVAQLSKALEAWSTLVTLQSAVSASSLFVFSPQSDSAPRYRSLFARDALQSMLGIDPSRLVVAITDHLRLAAEYRERSALPAASGIGDELLLHVSAAWGDISERTFQRTPANGSLRLCIGMTALHYQLAGQRPFNAVLERHEEPSCAIFKANNGAADIWATAFDAQSSATDNMLPDEHIEFVRPTIRSETPPPVTAPTEEAYPTFEVQLVNHSPGGYCLAWPAEVPAQLQAGELLGLRDGGDKGWSVAVVRWIRQVRGGGAQMGIELIAPQAQPCGLRLLRKAEQASEYLRALLLPEIAAISQPATLIAPRLPFQQGHKVLINQDGEEQRAVLNRRQSHTGNYNQFEYRLIGELPAERETLVTAWGTQGNSSDGDFDSLWKSL